MDIEKMQPSCVHREENDVSAGLQDGDNEYAAQSITYFSGIRLHLIMASVVITTFLSTMEVPIVTTSLISISKNLGESGNTTWIITSYLLGFVGFIIILSKLSDIFGRKILFLLSLIIFLTFSAACGAAQSTSQLIIFRAFQGLGAGGSLGLGTIVATEAVPESKYASWMASLSATGCLGLVAGPIIGGAVNDGTTWRWIFIINIPPIAVAIAIVICCIPRSFPFHRELRTNSELQLSAMFTRKNLARVDHQGVWLLLIASTSLIAALEEAGITFPWKSAYVIALMVVSGLFWVLFLAWEYRATYRNGRREPALPWRILANRVSIGLLLVTTFTGAVSVGSMFVMVQRFQVSYNVSPMNAGVKLIPFNGASAFGAMLGPLMSKAGVPPIFLVLAGSITQIIGLVLLGKVEGSSHIVQPEYGFEVVAGLGCGINTAVTLLMTPFAVSPRDKAVAVGAMSQFRFMGGALGVAVAHAAIYGYIPAQLESILPANHVEVLLNSGHGISRIKFEDRAKFYETLGIGFGLPMEIYAGFAGIQLLCTLLLWRKKQMRV